MLKMSEEEAAASLNASAIALRKLNLHHQIETRLDEETENFYLNSDNEVVYFDTLEAMLMALNAGDIDFMRIYSTVADYLCERNENLIQLVVWDKPEKTDCSAVPVYKNLLQNDFAFMMLEGKEALREEFSIAIKAMEEDGTLEKLAKEHIEAAIAGREISPVEIPKTEGAETIIVAITGVMPPMDYIAADGTPAGYNTAILAEISRRIGKNIELVQVDSLGRATALASGVVDVVFWTRANIQAYEDAMQTDEQKAETWAKINEKLSSYAEEHCGDCRDNEITCFCF